MAPEPRLDARLLIGGEYILRRAEWPPLPPAFIEIEDAACLDGEGRVAREDPAPRVPGADGVSMEPAPDGGPADLGDQALREHFPSEFRA
jgi:hypothetical protein